LKIVALKYYFLLTLLAAGNFSFAQDATVKARIDTTRIIVGDRANLFIELQHNSKQSRVQWAALPDTFNSLEIVEKGKIDTVTSGDIITYKQHLLITGFDSGEFEIPPFIFSAIPKNALPYTIHTNSLKLLVQTIALDTTKPFKPIKDIIPVKYTWRDYMWHIGGALLFLILLGFIIYYFIKNRKTPAPVIVPTKPAEPITDKYLRLFGELEQKQLWQKGQVKEYYVELSDLLRTYIEERFRTPAMELTTDEILEQSGRHKEMVIHRQMLGEILYTADLAKFAKAQPLPYEHTNALEHAKQFIKTTKPVETVAP
jgi:hypothetical protein